MKRVFADTAYFVAPVRKRDQLHRQASYFHDHPPGKLLTTEGVSQRSTVLVRYTNFRTPWRRSQRSRLRPPGGRGKPAGRNNMLIPGAR